MPKYYPKVTIIILNWNGAADTLALLRDLGKVTYPNFSILVVDNGSSDDSVGKIVRYIELLRQSSNDLKITLLPLPENLGYAGGNNKGLQRSGKDQPDYYLLLNNDTLLEPDFLEKLVEAAGSEEKLAAVGPTVYFADQSGGKTERIWFAGGWLNFLAGGAHHNTNQKPETSNQKLVTTEFLTGCCLLIKRSALRKVGQLFDPVFFAYGEDVDLSIRLQNAGYRLGYVPASIIWHKLATSSGGPKSSNFWYYNVRNNFLIVARYGSWYHWPIFILYFLFYKPVAWSIAGAILKPRPDKWQRLSAIWQGTVDAIRGQWGKRS